MIRLPIRTTLAAVCLTLSICTGGLHAAPTSESLLPDTTKGYVSVPNVKVLCDSFNATQWGRLVHDPVMQPFVEDFRQQIKQNGSQRFERIGLALEDLEGVPSGEVCVAVVQPSADKMVLVALVDVTGHEKRATALLDKIAANLTRQDATRVARDAADPITVYDLPKREGQSSAHQAAYFVHNGLLAASDDVEVLTQILAAQSTPRKDSLANFEPFHQIMDRCAKSAGTTAPQIRWFLEPFGYVAAIRAANPPREKHKGLDLLKILRDQGFTAIQGLGGYLNFGADHCELVHRTMVYAPPLKGRDPDSKDKYDLAARMLRFPVSSELEPQTWVPTGVSTYHTFNWDIKNAFASVESLVDEVMAEKGVFRDVLDSMKNDPEGPKVDIEKDLVGNLGQRVTIISDYELPIGPKCERLVFAVETTNPAVVAETVAKSMKGDKDAHRSTFEGHVIWEITDEQTEVPELTIESPEGVPVAHADSEEDKQNAKGPSDGRLLPNAAVTVAFGHLFVSTHVELLKKVLHQASQTDGLIKCPDYQFVSDQMKTMGAGPVSFRFFSRTDEEFRPTYELIRTGQMPKSETLFGQVLNVVLGDGKDGTPRKQRIDGSKLPEFTAVAKYLGPAGAFITSERDGWFIEGFNLNHDAVPKDTIAKVTVATKTPAKEAVPEKAPVKEAATKEPNSKPVGKETSPTTTSAEEITGQKPVDTAKK